MKEHFQKNKWYYLATIVITAIMGCYLYPHCKVDLINYDSAYQYCLTVKSWSEIWKLFAEDYSPPLYTILLKLFTMVFGETLLAMRLFYLIPFMGMIYIALFPVREAFGKKTSYLCAFIFSISSLNIIWSVEIRPGTLTYFFVTAAAIYAYLSLYKNSKSHIICLTVFSILSMYTHNVGMLAALGYYIVILMIVLLKRNYQKLKSIFISGLIAGITYTPWLLTVLKQFSNVQSKYWEDSDYTYKRIVGSMLSTTFVTFRADFNIMDPSTNTDLVTPIIVMIVIIALIKAIDIKNLKNKSSLTEIEIFNYTKHSKEIEKTIVFICLIFAPVVALWLFSIATHPIFAARYLYTLSGVVSIGVAVLLANTTDKITLPIIVLAMLFNFSYATYNRYESIKNENFSEMVASINERVGDGTPAFIHTHEWTLGMMMYYYPEARHYVADDFWTVLNSYEVFPTDVINIGDYHNISDYEEYFFSFGGTYPKTTSNTIHIYDDTERYDMKLYGLYEEPYSYAKIWGLYEVDCK